MDSSNGPGGAVTYRSDAAILADPKTQALCRQLSPLLSVYRAQLGAKFDSLPSYLRDAMIGLFDAADRFEREARLNGR